jgi:hypothetical protein
MKRSLLICLISIYLLNFAIAQPFEQKLINVGNIGMTLSNFGTVGQPNIRNNPSGNPSLEYPINSGIEHLFEGGIWIGSLVNGQTRVSTASVDASTGYYTGGSGFEFTALGPIKERSSLSSSEFYSGTAISHQDFLVNYTDSNTVVPGTSTPISDHKFPLKAVVNMQTYAWNFSFADYFVILNFEITNKSNETWDSVYMGFWTDLVVRNVNVTQDAGTAFFNKGCGGFIDSFNSIYVFEYNGDDYDYTQSYVASQILGVEWRGLFYIPQNSGYLIQKGYKPPVVSANFWNYKSFDGSQFGAPEDDIQKYAKMKKGLVYNAQGTLPELQIPSNKTQLISIGPIPEILPGEKIVYTMAFVCAKQMIPHVDNEQSKEQLLEHLNWAKRTYMGEDLNGNGVLDAGEDLNEDNVLNRYILPEPPKTPNTKIIASANKVDIYWDKSSVTSADPITKKMDFEGFRLYRSKIGDDLKLNMIQNAKLIGTWDSVGNDIGFNNGFSQIELKQPLTFEGDSVTYYFHYSIEGLLNGWQYLFILTAFDKGDKELNLASLESSLTGNAFGVFAGSNPDSAKSSEIGVYPNPYKISASWDGNTSRTHKIYFYNLPERCDIIIYGISGEVIRQFHHDGKYYQGDDIQWFQNYSGSTKKVFSGGEHAWDLLSENGQAVTQGLYLFSVKDLTNNTVKIGKFAIIK